MSRDWRGEWSLREGVTFLNHGAFGLIPRAVQAARFAWQDRWCADPVDFVYRQFEPALRASYEALSRFVGGSPRDFLWCDNATFGMNIVAESLDLKPGDEVLLTDHEYGAVRRIWQKRCEKVGAKVVVQRLPLPLISEEEIVAKFLSAVTERTRIIVVSQVTSPTAVILPVAEICREAKQRFGITVCIDGPHAVAMQPLNLRELGCDFFCASCHKWLCAPNGSGFLYATPKWQSKLEPLIVSWGGSVGGFAPSWQDEFHWSGTRDASAFFAVPPAIHFLEQASLNEFRQHGHTLARYARNQLLEVTGTTPLTPDEERWFGTMVAIPLSTQGKGPPAPGQRDPLQEALWHRHQIEIPITWWQGLRLLRVSCHLYNMPADIDHLVESLRSELTA